MPVPRGVQARIVGRLRDAGCVFAEEEADLLLAAARTPDQLDELVGRRATGEPLEHVVGWAEFCGLPIAVDAGVFVPRRRSELLAAQAVRWAARESNPVVVDLCCGSGALGLVVATQLPGVRLHASDVEPAAVACARRNLAAVGGAVYLGDLDEPLPAQLRGTLAVLVANVPYVPTGALATLPAEARLHEPRRALDGGPDGLDVVRRLAGCAPGWLASGGVVLVETTRAQAPAAQDCFARNGLTPSVEVSDDLDGCVVAGRR
jgi:release factor glutamine methyltransferase